MPTLPSKDSLEILEPMERPTSIITFEEGEPLRGARAISCKISVNLTYGGIPFAAMTAMSSGLKPERHHEHLARGRVMSGRTGCGLCGIDDFSPLLQACAQKVSALNVPLEVIRRALTVLESEQTLNECAHATDAAAWADLDGTTRCPFELVEKIAPSRKDDHCDPGSNLTRLGASPALGYQAGRNSGPLLRDSLPPPRAHSCTGRHA